MVKTAYVEDTDYRASVSQRKGVKDFQWKKIIQKSKLSYKLWMAKANYSYMNYFGSLNEVRELPPFALDRAANRALEIIHGEQSNTNMDTLSNIQYTAEQSNTWTAENYTINMESRAIHMDTQKMSREREKERLRMSQVNLRSTSSSPNTPALLSKEI